MSELEAIQLVAQWVTGWAEALSGLAALAALLGVGVICGYALALRSEAKNRRHRSSTWETGRPWWGVDYASQPDSYEIHYQTECGECGGDGGVVGAVYPESETCHECAGTGLVDIEASATGIEYELGGNAERMGLAQ